MTPIEPKRAGEIAKRLRRANDGTGERWLWPEIPIREWQIAVAGFESVIRAVLTDGHSAVPLCGQPRVVGIAAYTSGMGPLLGYWLSTGALQAETSIEQVLSRHLANNRVRMRMLFEQASRLVHAMVCEGVRPVMLKGIDTAYRFFPEPGARPMSDIDVLINAEDHLRATRALKSLGYRRAHSRKFPHCENWKAIWSNDLPQSLEMVEQEDPWSIDMHMTLDRRNSPGSPRLRLDQAGLLASARSWAGCGEADALDGMALVFFLLVHASNLPSLSLIRLVELTFAIRHFEKSGQLDWHLVREHSSMAGAEESVLPALKMVERLVPGTVPDEILCWSESYGSRELIDVLDELSPSSAQTVTTLKTKQKLMWTPTWSSRFLFLIRALFLPHMSMDQRLKTYGSRIRRVFYHIIAG